MTQKESNKRDAWAVLPSDLTKFGVYEFNNDYYKQNYAHLSNLKKEILGSDSGVYKNYFIIGLFNEYFATPILNVWYSPVNKRWVIDVQSTDEALTNWMVPCDGPPKKCSHMKVSSEAERCIIRIIFDRQEYSQHLRDYNDETKKQIKF